MVALALSVLLPAPAEAQAPAKVTGVTVFPGPAELSVSWDAATNADGYKVQWKSGSQSYDPSRQHVVDGSGRKATSATIGPLLPGTTYMIQVIATRSGSADGEPSDEASGTPTAPTVTLLVNPGQVFEGQSVQAKARVGKPLPEDVIVTVTASADAGYTLPNSPATITIPAGKTESNAPANGVLVQTRDNDYHSPDGFETLMVTSTVSGGGTLVNPAPASLLVVDDEQMPEAELVLSFDRISEDGEVVDVRARLSNASSVETTLTVSVTPEGTATEDDFELSANRVLTIPAKGLFSTGEVTITSVNDDEPQAEKVLSVTAEVTTGSVLAPRADTLTIFDDEPTAIIVSDNMLTLHETGRENTRTYTVQLNNLLAPSLTVALESSDANVVRVDRSSLTFTSGNFNWPQVVRVTAVDDDIPNAGGSRTAVIEHTATGLADKNVDITVTDNDRGPEKVTGVTVTSGVEQLTVNWNRVTEADGYKVQWKSGGDTYTSGRRITVSDGAVTTATIKGLDGGVEYTVQVIATRTNTVDGEASDEVTGTPMVDPNRVGGVRVTPGPANLTVNWDRVTGANGYKVQWRSGRERYSPAIRQNTINSGATTTSVIGDLKGNTEYVVRVIAVLADGSDGPPSKEVAGMTLADPNQVRGVTVTPGPANLTVNWDGVTGADGYKVQWKLGMGSKQEYDPTTRQNTINNGATTTSVIGGLDGSTEYVVRVIAVLADGSDGPPSKEVAGTPIITRPGVTISQDTLDIGEGESGTYTVVLNARPAANVVFEASVDQGTDDGARLSISPAGGLTFTPGNWYEPQAFTVESTDDDVDWAYTTSTTPDNTDDVFIRNITHSIESSAPPEYRNIRPSPLTLRVTEDDQAGLIVEPSEPTVAEGDTDTYTVKLASEPEGPIALTTRSSDNNIVGTSTGILRWNEAGEADWDTPLTVTVVGRQDTVFNRVPRTADIMYTYDAWGGAYGPRRLPLPSTEITVTDDETEPANTVAFVTVTPGVEQLTVKWDGLLAATGYKVQWKSGSESFDASRQIEISERSIVTATIRGLTADTEYSVQVIAVLADGDGPPSREVKGTPTAPVPGLTLSTDTLTVAEGGQATYTVKLDSQPSGTIIVALGLDPRSSIEVSSRSLEFGRDDWNTPQTVIVTGIDNDYHHPGSISEEITHTPFDGARNEGFNEALNVTITEDEMLPTATLTLSDTSISENGGMATVDVELDHPSSGSTTFTVLLMPDSIGTTNDFTLDPTSAEIIVPAREKDAANTVTITAVDNSAFASNKTFTVSAAASGRSEIDDPATVSLTITDDDAPGVTVSEDSVTVAEASGTATYTVVLNTQPTGTVTIDLTSTDTNAATVGPARLSFTPSNWNTAQTVTVTGVNDDVVNPNGRRTTSIEHDAAGGGYGSVTINDVDVTVNDDDIAGVTVSEASVTVTEASGARNTATYTVVLNTQPASTVTIDLTSDDPDAATVDPASLSFTTSNWNTPQTVTVTGVDEDVANPNGRRTTSIKHDATGGDYGSVNIADVGVTVEDDDSPGVKLSKASVTVTEASGTSNTDTYTVALNTQPTSTVTIDLTSEDTAAATVDPRSLTFTTSNWNTAQTVTVTGVDDDVVNSNGRRTTNISHDASGGDYGSVTIADVGVTVNDDDVAGVTVSEASVTVTEASGASNTATYTVVLNTQPASAVTIDLTSTDTGAATVDPASLSFTTSNWNTAQTVTVTGVDDTAINPNGRRTTSISHDADGGGYGSVNIADVGVTVNDDDVAGVTVSEDSVTVTEASGASNTATYTVVLDRQPTGAVTIDLTSDDTDAATVDPARLSFTTSNWNTPQTVTVTGVDEDVVNPNGRRTTNIKHEAAGGSYGSVTITDVSVTVNDDDVAGVTVSEASVTVTEASGARNTATYTVVLNTQPASAVTITLASEDTAAATVDPGSLSFTTSNWNTAQTVTVTGVDEDVANPNGRRTTSISHDADGGGYGSVNIADVGVTVEDDDSPGVKLSEASVTVTEASGASNTATYTVALNTQPTSAVTITLASEDTASATVDPASLAFTTSNWNTAQTVTVTGVDDDVVNSNGRRTTNISHDASGGDYASINIADVGVTVSDDDRKGVMVSEASVTVTEASGASNTDTYTVVLTSRPQSTSGGEANVPRVTVTPESSDGDVATVSGALTFTTSNWNTPQTVTVTAMDDSVSNPGGSRMATISHRVAASETDYATGVTVADVSVSVTDDEVPPDTIALSVDPDRISENGGATTITVTAEVEGSALSQDRTVEVTVAGSGNSNAVGFTAVPTTLSVTISSGSRSGTGTVTITPDDNSSENSNETVTFSGTNAEGHPIKSARLTIVDNDVTAPPPPPPPPPPSAPAISLAASPGTIDEGDGATTVTLTATVAGGETFSSDQTVSVEVTGSGVEDAVDFTADSATFDLVITAGESSGTATVVISPEDDNVRELPETVTFSGSSSGDSDVTSASLTITDNDEPSLSIDSPTVDEGDTGARPKLVFTVTMDRPSIEEVTVDYTDRLSGTATSGTDYEVLLPGTLEFAVGETVQTIEVTVIGDNLEEGTETVVVRIANPVNATIATNTGTGTITGTDDSTPPRMSIGGMPHFIESLEPVDLTFNFSEAVVGFAPDVVEVENATKGELTGSGGSYAMAVTPDGGGNVVVSVGANKVTDAAGNPGPPAAVSVMGILAVNEAPVFAEDSYEFELPENQAGPWGLGSVSATDSDGDLLTYAIHGADAANFRIVVGNGTMEYTGSGEDFETPPAAYVMMATVMDPEGLSDTAAVTVRVTNGEEPPEAVGTITPPLLSISDLPWTVELTDYFTDPDGQVLAYTVTVDDENVVRATVSGSTLSLMAVGGGSASGTVTATDPDGLAASQFFGVTVEATDGERSEAVKMALAGLGTVSAGGTVTVIGDRLSDGLGSGGSGVSVGGRNVDLAGFSSAGSGAKTLLKTAADVLGIGSGLPSLRGGGSMMMGYGNGGSGGGFGLGFASGVDAGTGQLSGLAQWASVLNGNGSGSFNFRDAVGYRGVSAVELLSRSSFQLDMGNQDVANGGGWTLWGKGTAGGFVGPPQGEITSEGRVYAGYLGADFSVGSNVLAGVAVSRSQGDMEFTTPMLGDGTLESRITSVNPYLQWAPRPGFGAWATVGYGWGDADITDREGELNTGINMRMAAVGTSSALLGLGRTLGLNLNTDAFLTSVSADSVEGRLRTVNANTHRVRMALEAKANLRLSDATSLTPSVEVGGRLDGGDLQSGLGMEVGGGLGFVNTSIGLSMNASGRWLVAHQEEGFEEWGAAVDIQVGSGVSERGLALTLTPSWGNPEGRTDALWGDSQSSSSMSSNPFSGIRASRASGPMTWRPRDVNMQLRYGLGLAGDGALLTPFGEVRTYGGDSRSVRMGTRLALGSRSTDRGGVGRLQMELVGEQRASRSGGEPEYLATMQLRAPESLRVAGGLLAPFGEVRVAGMKGRQVRLGADMNVATEKFRAVLPTVLQLRLFAEHVDLVGEEKGYKLGLAARTPLF